MSEIRAAIAVLAGLTIEYTTESNATVTVNGTDVNNTPFTVTTAHLPLRTIRTYSGETGFSNFQYLAASGCLGSVTWRLLDTYFHCAANSNQGVHKKEPDLIRYAGAYLDKMLQNRNLTDGIRIDSMSSYIGFQEYPPNTNGWWEVVRVTLTLTELLG